MNIKRILYSSLVDVSVPYGPGVNERGFIKDMARRFGDNFKVVIPRPSKGLPDDLSHADVSYLNYSRTSRTPLGWLEARVTGCFKLISMAKIFNPDLIVIRPGAFSLPQFFLSRCMSVSYALKTAGGGNYDAFYKTSPARRIFSGINEYIFSKLLRKCITVDMVSDLQRRSLTEKYPWIAERAYMIDNGADLEMFSSKENGNIRKQLGFSENDLVVGYVGAFPMRRGGKEVIDLVKYLQGSLPIKGIVVGDSGEADQCRQYADENDIGQLVIITGQIDYEDVPKCMKAMDVGLSILRPEQQNACEQKIRQYLSSGLCVVGTPGSNDFLKGYDFARIVSGESIAEIAEAVLSLVKDDPDGLNKRADTARQFAQEELSIESRNSYRLKLWEDALAKAEARK